MVHIYGPSTKNSEYFFFSIATFLERTCQYICFFQYKPNPIQISFEKRTKETKLHPILKLLCKATTNFLNVNQI